MREQVLVAGDERVALRQRARDDQPIEWISRPRETQGVRDDVRQRRFDEAYADRPDQIAHDLGAALREPPDLMQALQLELDDGAHQELGGIDPATDGREPSTVPSPQPNGNVCVELGYGFHSADHST